MKNKLKVILNISLIIISLLVIFIVIRYKISNRVFNPFVMIGEETDIITSKKSIKLSITDCIIIFISLYILLLSIINLVRNKKYNIYIFIINLVLSFLLSFISIFIINNYILKKYDTNYIKHPYNSYIVSPKGIYEYDSDKKVSNKKIVGNKEDTNSILVKNGSNVTITNSKIYKYGDSKDLNVSKVYGTNSAILALKDSYINISNSSINTFSSGGNGLFSVLENSKIDASLLTINTSGKESIGIVSSINSEIKGYNVTIKTSSVSSPTLSSIRGAKMYINGSILKTTAVSSPLISTDSIINLEDSIGDANDSPAVYMTGNPTLKISNCKLNVTANKINEKSYDGAFILYNEFINNDYKKNSKISIYDSEINIKKQSKVYSKAPLFSIINSNAIINISNNDFNYGSNIFLNIKNTDTSRNMLIVLNSDNQEINGNIELSKNTSLELNLKNSMFYGNINHNKKGEKITLNIDNNSKVTLTNDSYVSIINDENKSFDNIISNGYTLYYDKEFNKELNGKTIKLSDGGKIKPI